MPGRRISPVSWARSRARKLHALAWRDEAIRKFREERARYGTAAADEPSFFRQMYADRRINAHMADRNLPDRGNLVARKLKAYSFAQSHGVRIPVIHGIWDSPEEIRWDDLPDGVVIKTHTGAFSRGVFPLRRNHRAWTIVTQHEPVSSDEIVERLRQLTAEGRIGGPYFAEELLGGGRDNALPTETRIFAFYGEVGMVNVRKPTDHGNPDGTAIRRFLEDGTPGPLHPSHDETLQPPALFDELVAVGRRLSLSIPRPFCRIDLYDVDGEVVFGELTPRPGGSQNLGPETDLRLGELWERAQARLLNDVIDGADLRLRFGPNPRELQVGDTGTYVADQGWSTR